MNRFEQLKDILMTENCFKMICGAGNEDAPYVKKLSFIYTLAGAKILDVSDYTNAAGSTAATASLNKIWYSVSVTAKVDALRMSWDNSGTDPVFLTLEGDGFFDYSLIGGIKNNQASNYTGDVNVTLPACTSGDSATVTCEWILNY